MENQALTQEQIDQYVATDGVCCPRCKSQDLTGRSVEIDAGGAYQEVDCENCHASWTDCYTLTGVIEKR